MGRFYGNCHYCGKQGHMERDCRKKLRDVQVGGTATAMLSTDCSGTEFAVDSGASTHFSKNKDIFTSMKPSDSVIQTANGKMKPSGIGTATVYVEDVVGNLQKLQLNN